MLGFYVRLQIRRIRRFVVTIHARVWLFASVRSHVFFELRRMSETFSTLDANMREALTVNGQQVAIEQTLLCSLVIAKLAFVRLVCGGGRNWRCDCGGGFLLAVMVLEPMREQRRLLVELFPTGLALERGFVGECMHLHVVVQTGFLVGGEVAVGALVLLAGQHVLVVVARVPLQEATGLEFLATEHAGIDGQRLSVRADDDRW